jgi:hypothetical protein
VQIFLLQRQLLLLLLALQACPLQASLVVLSLFSSFGIFRACLSPVGLGLFSSKDSFNFLGFRTNGFRLSFALGKKSTIAQPISLYSSAVYACHS